MSSDTMQTIAPGTVQPALHRSGLNWWQALGAGAIASALVNLLILGIGHLANASFVILDGSEAHQVDAGGVILSSVVPLIVGAGAAILLALWKTVFLRTAQYLGAALALLSVWGPLTVDADGGTIAALSLMHITLGIAVVTSLEAYRRHRLGR
ncbi:DUF6069 family protein [Streptomyces gobiensis]|uniref:DUF6069 family protein n=1 Tax=Streptomyces gobiensis TaxID=2875706 RepID=UPI001E33CB10|nr:DUF6069 family protein [Streptomyces gobiensis]UGY94458.1 DUF6069 family protein [Streptomyces gobiensis]